MTIDPTGWADSAHYQRPMFQSPAEGRLVSYTLPASGISVSAFLRRAEGQERMYWQNGQGDTIFAGFGVAIELMAWGATRFQEIRQNIKVLFLDAVNLTNQPKITEPRFFGGFAFQDDFIPDNAWATFHPAHFILPHYQLVTNDKQTWLTINAMIQNDEDLPDAQIQLHEALQTRLEILLQDENSGYKKAYNPSDFRIQYPMSYEKWQGSIEQAISQFKSSKLEKVVLSRVCELRSKQRIDICQALSYLNTHYQECTRFLFEPRPYHAYYGATPEVLAETTGKQLKTMALAGSSQRGKNSRDDAAMSRQLFANKKDRYEHQLVVDSIRRRLEQFRVELEIPSQPEIYTLSYIHHLHTPIKGCMKDAVGILPIIEALHPTPALGGSPRELALDFICHAEPVPRGWYAAPIGWINADMDGQFAVGIRSAVAQERRVWFYAGAGIVPESNPENEWMETTLKFQPMFTALGLNIDIANGSAI